MGQKNALESSGVMMASGDKARFDALEPHLAKMTGKLVYLGPLPERAGINGSKKVTAKTTGASRPTSFAERGGEAATK